MTDNTTNKKRKASDTEQKEAKRKSSQVEFFACTMFAEGEHMKTQDQVRQMLDCVSHEWRFKKEKSLQDDGKYHWQIAFRVHGKSSVNSILQFWSHDKGYNTTGVSLQSAHDWQAVKKYITKSQTAVGEVFRNKEWMDDKYDNPIFWDWQSDVMMMESNDRFIDLLWNPNGGEGKTWMCGYLESRRGAYYICLPTPEKAIESLTCMLKANEERHPSYVLIDIPRNARKEHTDGWIRMAETIKSGSIADPRYRYQYWRFKSPPVWVFCNDLPNITGYKADRLRVWKIENKKLVQYQFDEIMKINDELQEKRKFALQSEHARLCKSLDSIAEAIRGINPPAIVPGFNIGKPISFLEKLAMEDNTAGDDCDNSEDNQSSVGSVRNNWDQTNTTTNGYEADGWLVHSDDEAEDEELCKVHAQNEEDVNSERSWNMTQKTPETVPASPQPKITNEDGVVHFVVPETPENIWKPVPLAQVINTPNFTQKEYNNE